MTPNYHVTEVQHLGYVMTIKHEDCQMWLIIQKIHYIMINKYRSVFRGFYPYIYRRVPE